MVALAGAGVALAVGDAGAQQAGIERPVGVNDTALRFNPTEVTVSVGDTVVWDFTGATTAHNVVSENDVADDPAFIPGFVVLLLLYAVGFVTIRRMVDLKV